MAEVPRSAEAPAQIEIRQREHFRRQPAVALEVIVIESFVNRYPVAIVDQPGERRRHIEASRTRRRASRPYSRS